MKKNLTNFPHWGRLWSAGITLVLLAISSGPAAAVTDSLLHLESFASGLPGTWSKNSSWISSANGNGGTGGSMYCDLYHHNTTRGVLSTPGLDASSYSNSIDSVWLDFDLCWQFNNYDITLGNDTLIVTTGADVLLSGLTSNLQTYSTADFTIVYDPPTGTAYWRHYHLLVPVSSRTSDLTISFMGSARKLLFGLPKVGATNPAIDNVSITAKPGQQRLTLSRYSIDFGKVRVGTTMAEMLTLYSSAPELPVTILSNRMEEGDPFSSYPASSERVLENGSNEIDTVMFSPTDRGTYTDAFLIATNSDTVPEQHISVGVTGQGVQAIFSPLTTTVDFGKIRVGHSTQHTFIFANTGDDTLFLDPYFSGSAFSFASEQSTFTVLPGQTQLVTLQFLPEEWRAYQDTLFVNPSNGVQAVPIVLTGIGTLPQVTMADFTSLGTQRVGGILQSMVTLSNTGDDTLHINCARLRQPLTLFGLGSYEHMVPPGETDTFNMVYAPTERGFDTTSLVLRTDDPNHPTPTMTIVGQGIQGVFYPTSGSVFDFGHLRMGYTRQQTFTFSNIGDDTLFLQQSPTISGCSFSIVSGPEGLIVPPGESGEVQLQFAPHINRSYSGTLSFTVMNNEEQIEEDGNGDVESDPDPIQIIQTVDITLAGLGTAPQIAAPEAMTFATMRVDRMELGTVTVSNTSPYDTLHISEPSIIQPASVFVLGAHPEILLPGESGTFHLQYFPTATGIDNGTLSFSTDDPTQPTVSILLTGTGALPEMLVANARDTIDLGQVRVNSSTTRGFVVSNVGTWDLVLSEPSTTGGAFSVANYPHVLAMGTTNIVSVTFTPTTTGPFTGNLLISGDDPNNPTAVVYLKGTGINSALAIEPASVDFGIVPVYTTVADTVILHNTGTASLTINSCQLAPLDDGFGVVFNAATIPPGGTSSVIVGFRPDAVGNYSGTLTLYTDEAGNPIRVINLYGIGVKGVLALSPSMLNFGTVMIGHDSTMRAWLKNTGGADLTINALQVVGAAFSSGAFETPSTIAAGDSTYVDFTFRPTLAGPTQGGVAITLGDGSLVTMELLGEGMYPESVEGTTTGTQNTLAVTPNPAATDVTAHVTLGAAANGQLHVFDITGHEVLNVSLGQHSEGSFDLGLPVQNLPSGTYFVRLTNVNGAGASARLVIQR